MLTERDAQEAEKSVRAIEDAADELESLIFRAREKGWTNRLGPLRDTLASLEFMARETAGLFG